MAELSEEEAAARYHRQKAIKRGPSYELLLPLVYAPLLPLIRIGLRKQPQLRDRVFTVGVGAALLHGAYLVYLPPKPTLTPYQLLVLLPAISFPSSSSSSSERTAHRGTACLIPILGVRPV
eukprot:jgi/Mesen1/361/ME000001S02678